MSRSRCLVVAAAAVSFLLPLAAQVPSGGVLAGAPAAILVDGGLPGSTDVQTRVHKNGFVGPTSALPAAAHPADLQAVFTSLGVVIDFDVDDLSTGRDDVLFAGDGTTAVPPSSWGVLQFSLRNGAVGDATSGGPRIVQQALEGDVGAALFSWILPGSTVPLPLVGRTERSHSRRELGLPLAGALEVDGLDVPLVLGLEQGALAVTDPNFAALVPTTPAIYFTVSHATRGQVPPSWWLFGSAMTAPSGASILRTQRNPASGQWSVPQVFVPYFVLGLGQDEDIDGLAYDQAREMLLFSCTGFARDQLLVFDLGSDGPPGPQDAKLPNGGGKVSEKIGKADNDDVDAVCTLDPRIGSIGAPPPAGDDFGSSCGTPVAGLLGVPQLHASAFRRRVGNQNLFDSWLVGWPPLTGQGNGIAVLFVTFDPDLTLYPFSIQLRDPADVLPGNPIQASVVVPDLQGFQVTFRWAAMDLALTEIAEAWPQRVFL
ncbi:MAG: hypothetical protein JNL08_19895 [Planctomycetes bacterium]|nr:hypothetical protein [Planctomycetota bacterium]